MFDEVASLLVLSQVKGLYENFIHRVFTRAFK